MTGPSKIGWTDDDLLLAYLAGFIDGEGSIAMMRRRGYTRKTDGQTFDYWFLKLLCVNANPTVIHILQERFGKGQLYHYENGHRGFYQWYVKGPTATAALKALLPHLRLKGEQAKLAVEFADLQKEQNVRLRVHSGPDPHPKLTAAEMEMRNALVEKIKSLNGRGSKQGPNRYPGQDRILDGRTWDQYPKEITNL